MTAAVLACTTGCRQTRAEPGEESQTPPPPPSLLSKALQVAAEYATAALANDPDDPAIWVHPTDPSRSLIIGTDKKQGLDVYDLAGKRVQSLPDGRMNNVDLRYRFRLGNQEVAIVAATNRTDQTLALYAIDANGRLSNGPSVSQCCLPTSQYSIRLLCLPTARCWHSQPLTHAARRSFGCGGCIPTQRSPWPEPKARFNLSGLPMPVRSASSLTES